MEIKKFCQNGTEIVYLVIDNNNHETFVVVELDCEDRRDAFRNQIIADHLEMACDNPPKDWAELDRIITRIKRAGVVFI